MHHHPTSSEPILPDVLANGLDVIFVGAAPSYYAAEVGHYYAGPRNRFWLLLHQAGFTPRQLLPEEDFRVIEFGIGMTAILPHLVSSANHSLPPTTQEQRVELVDKLLRYAPRYVCYNGKDVYRMCYGMDAPRWGLQPGRLGTAQQFVVHSTSGRADAWGADRLYLFKELKRLIDEESESL
jgi:double-stranded uracil-DNA glycosylase